MNDVQATVAAAAAFALLAGFVVVRAATRADGPGLDVTTAWSTGGAMVVALAGLLAVALVSETTVAAWTAGCFGLYAVWATGQIVAVVRGKTWKRALPRFLDLVAVSAACVTITLFPLIAR